MTRPKAEMPPVIRTPGGLHSLPKTAKLLDFGLTYTTELADHGIIRTVMIGGHRRIHDDEITRVQADGVPARGEPA